MVNIEQENKKLRLDIQDYDGCSEEEIYAGNPSQRDSKKNSFNFQRKQSNHGYTSGETLSFNRDCCNNLIISTYESNFFKNIRNAFILANEDGVEISPISNIWNAISKGNRMLSGNINYSIPKRVLSRENLPPVDVGQLKEELKVKYGLSIEDINPLLEGRSKNGIYVLTKGRFKFILKYRGDNKERSESISQVLESIEDYFPRIFPRVDKTEGYTIKIGENYFGLEEFIEEKERPDLSIGYFPLLGNHMGKLHNSFSFFLSKNPGLAEKLQRKDSFNEASIISIYLDLMKNNPNKHGFLVDSLDEILRDDFMEEILKINNLLKNAYVTDIGAFSERSKNPKIDFIVQPSLVKTPFLENELNNIVLSLILHHLDNLDQELFIKHLTSILKDMGRLTLIEEGYPENYLNENLSENIKQFLSFEKKIKMKIISFYDWFGNKIMRNRDNIALTFNYKTIEEWEEIFCKAGLKLIHSDFIGKNPKHLDLYPPKIVMVFEKMEKNKK